MDAGRLRREGESVGKDDEDEKPVELGAKTVIDAMGNEIKVDKKKTLTDKERKQEIKKITKQINDARKKKTMSEEDILDLEIRRDELQAALDAK